MYLCDHILHVKLHLLMKAVVALGMSGYFVDTGLFPFFVCVQAKKCFNTMFG